MIEPKHEVDPDDFIRVQQILDTDYENYLIGYSCFEIAEYRDEETKRPISLEELQMKSTMKPLEY